MTIDCIRLCRAAETAETEYRFTEAAELWGQALLKFPFALLGSAEGKTLYKQLLQRYHFIAAAPLGHA
jgi:hypothetical protein